MGILPGDVSCDASRDASRAMRIDEIPHQLISGPQSDARPRRVKTACSNIPISPATAPRSSFRVV